MNSPQTTEQQTTEQQTLAVLLVDDHAVVRRGLTAYLDVVDDLSVAGEAASGEDALRLLETTRADVVLMDLLLPGMDGIETTKAILRDHPGVAVVVLTSFGEGERVRAALAAGASGYLLKDGDPDEVVGALRAAARGESHLSGRIARGLTRELATPKLGTLTARERDILKLVASGHANREIAEQLTISERTARTHVSNILAKLQVTSRTQAALLAIREGLAPLPGQRSAE